MKKRITSYTIMLAMMTLVAVSAARTVIAARLKELDNDRGDVPE